jgi:hypothetical protein
VLKNAPDKMPREMSLIMRVLFHIMRFESPKEAWIAVVADRQFAGQDCWIFPCGSSLQALISGSW